VVIPKDKTIQQVFVEGIKKIKKDQEDELKHFKAYLLALDYQPYNNFLAPELKSLLDKQNEMIAGVLTSLESVDKSKGTLKNLEIKNRLFNKLNAFLIQGRINRVTDDNTIKRVVEAINVFVFEIVR
jgi:hypothetical protein